MKTHCTPKIWEKDFLTCSPLFFPLKIYGHIFQNFSTFPTVTDLNQHFSCGVTSGCGMPIQFVKQVGARSDVGFDSLYEPRIFLKGEVKTRTLCWHDFFNALIWYSFPNLKSYLNQKMFSLFEAAAPFPWNVPPIKRSPLQDVLTLFDEGGCVWVSVQNKEGNVIAEIPYVYGHAYYERLAYGDRDLSCFTLSISVGENFLGLSQSKRLLVVDAAAQELWKKLFTENIEFRLSQEKQSRSDLLKHFRRRHYSDAIKML